LWRIGSPQLIEDVIADTAGGGSGLDVIATRIDEVGREIQRAVGLTREQFTQTVLLPQNEFARFLRAGTTERQAVLQRVFGTEATALEDEQVTALEEHTAGLRLAPLAELAEEHLAAVTARADEAAAAAERAGSAEQTARTAADTAVTALKRIDRRRELDALAQRLESEKPALETARAALERDETARPVVEVLRRRDTASAQAATAVEALAQLASSTRARHPELVDLLEGAEPAEA